MFKFFTYILLFFCSAAIADDYVPFKAEPTNKATFFSDAEIPKGSVLSIQIAQIDTNETLYLYRCGLKCNTARKITEWNASNQGKMNTYLFDESGDYYFWIQKQLANGESGPSFVTTFTGKTDNYTVLYDSKSKIVFNVKVP